MEYLEYINFYIQIRNQLDKTKSNDISNEITIDNIHLYFFNELEYYTLDNKTALEILTDILIKNKINIELKNDKIEKTYSNYLKVRKFLTEEETKYPCELLKINVRDYFSDNPDICKSFLINFKFIIDEALKNIDQYEQIILYDYEEPIFIEEAINLVKNFLKTIDPSNRLYISFIEFLTNENVFIWNEYNTERYNELRKSLLVKNAPYYDFYDSVVAKIDKEVYANIYYMNNLLDSYTIIHEFIHYYIAKRTNLEDESECSKFFAEFPSIFFEYLFNLYLKNNNLYEEDRDIQIETRKVENVKNVFIMSSTCRLHEEINKDNYNLQNLYETITNTLEFSNFIDKASFTYEYLIEEICDINKFYDLLNVNLSEIDYSNVINYISATLFSEELIKLVGNGKTYLVDKLIDVIDFLPYTTMDPFYVLEYLELNYRFLNFKQVGENVRPKRLEKIK